MYILESSFPATRNIVSKILLGAGMLYAYSCIFVISGCGKCEAYLSMLCFLYTGLCTMF